MSISQLTRQQTRHPLTVVAGPASCPLTAEALRDILLHDLTCRRRWLRHAQRSSSQLPNQAGVAWVLALSLWDRGDVSESRHTLPRSLKDRVSRALAGRLVSAGTLGLFVEAFDMSEEQEERLYAAWQADQEDRHRVSLPLDGASPGSHRPPGPLTVVPSCDTPATQDR